MILPSKQYFFLKEKHLFNLCTNHKKRVYYIKKQQQNNNKNKESILPFIFTSASESPNFSILSKTNWRSDPGVFALDVALLWIDQEIFLAKSTQICKEDIRSKAYLL